MNTEIKQCQNCQKDFVIEPEDFEFYEKISAKGGSATGGKVPAPTWCPECRLIRKLLWRNERDLYKRKCDAPSHNEEIISMYRSNSPRCVYDQKYFQSDAWDPLRYGREYDFTKPFFEQFLNLLIEFPVPNLNVKNDADSSFCNWTINTKECYLSVRLHDTENCMYVTGAPYTKDSIDILTTRKSEMCYETVDCVDCFKLIFGKNCEACIDSAFLYNCKNCSNCFGCVGLRNKQYYIFNQPYSKDDYYQKIKEWLGGFNNISHIKNEFENLKNKFPHKFAELTKTVNSLGDNLRNASNCLYCFDSSRDIENCRYLYYVVDGVRDCYDLAFAGLNSELSYEVLSFIGTNCLSVVFATGENRNIKYSINCHSCQDIFGCTGLKNKQYCILNKQYAKEEYEQLVPKIIQHMNDMPYIDKKGRVYKYGEFFPPELSPFAYNETIAQEYFPLTKEQAISQGYSWKDPEERNIIPDIKTEDLPDHIKDVPDNIVDKVIQCGHAKIKDDGTLELNCNEQCTTAFKIIKPELEFYRKMNLPLPRLCPNCRHYQRIKQRNPLKLWHRRCHCQGTYGVSELGIRNQESGAQYQNTIEHFHGNESCPNEFQTTYAPERPEIVYCEKCYLAEVV